jgi:protein-S-isoprenylcysteine O-methyltransferase Ste14
VDAVSPLRFSAQHGSTELTALNVVLLVVTVLGVASAVRPEVETAVGAAVLGVLFVMVLAAVTRIGRRWVRERREDRADEIEARAVRAARMTGGVR